jgi:hypothetical protein
MKIMDTKKIIFLGFILVLLGSCTKYLEPYPNGSKDSDQIWLYPENIQGLIGQCYDYINPTNNYNDNEGAYLDGATDNAVITSSTNTIHKLAINTITTSQDIFQTYWDRDYKIIREVNLFLKDRRGYNTKFILNSHWNDLVRIRLQGEAFALRAWAEWDLLQKFGGKGKNGQMLGFPIVTDVIDINANINYSRSTYDQCVQQIIADCDSAYKYLPIAHRDFLVPIVADRVYAGGKYWGRLDGITTRAIKAMLYLTWASPRFNTANDISRWDSAAANAKKVINFKLTVDNVTNGFNPVTQINWTNPNFPGIIWSSRYNNANDDMERMFYPGGFQGNGVIGATQELVDAFPMANGRPITDPLSGYNSLNPYTGRDPRFYSTIFYNTSTAIRLASSPAQTMYTFENWANGGKDAAGVKQNNSLTNYHIKKFVYMGLNWSDASVNRQPHSKFIFTWEQMCLLFAEAANQVVGPTDVAKYGISAKTAIQYLRARKTTDGLAGLSPVVPGAADAYLTQVAGLGKTAFDALVKNERRITTCFEGSRFYDLRRWTTDLIELNKAVHGAYIVKDADLSFTYNLNKEVESRNFTSAYLPIPYNEMLRMSNLIQNEGWDGWN